MQFAIQYCGVAPLQRSLSSVAEPGQQFVWLLPLSVAEPEPPFFAWSRSRLFLPGAGANPIWSEPESAPGPRTTGAAQKSGGSATLVT